MSDTEWLALMPYVERRSGPGRPLRELRTRMDGIFHLAAATTAPWHSLPAEFGRPDTVHRYFRRLTHAGLWQRLLHALAEAPEGHPSAPSKPGSAAPAAAPTASSASASSCWSAALACARPCPAHPGCCPTRICPKPCSAIQSRGRIRPGAAASPAAGRSSAASATASGSPPGGNPSPQPATGLDVSGTLDPTACMGQRPPVSIGGYAPWR
ncbi:transposase [Siccirubricoccus deserti]